MNIVLWIAQVLLAQAFLQDKTWATMDPGATAWEMTFIGISETAGGAEVVLRWLTGILPWLTPLAAVLLALFMFLAFVFHVFSPRIS